MTIQDDIYTAAHRAMVRAYLQAVEQALARFSFPEVERLIQTYQLQTLIEEFSISPADMAPFLDEMEGAIQMAAGTASLAGVRKIYQNIPFNRRHFRAEAAIREEGARLVQGVTDDSRKAIQQAVLRGVRSGSSPRRIAQDLAGTFNTARQVRTGGIIGLSAVQEEWSASATEELINLDRNYLTRKLRDRRYDPLFKRALASGQPLATADIIKLTQRYRDRLLRYRADTIARTEAHTALNMGRYQKILQTAEAAGLQPQDIEAIWMASRDHRVRDTHGAMRGDRARTRLGTPFNVGGHRMNYPGDRSLGAPAEEIVNCRCTLSFKAHL